MTHVEYGIDEFTRHHGFLALVNYTKYDIYCHMVFDVIMGTFWMTILMNKWANIGMDDGWVHPLVKTLHSLVSKLWWNIVIDAWNFDENHFYLIIGKWL